MSEMGEWSASRPDRPLPPGKAPPVPIGQEAGWVPEPAGMDTKARGKILCLYRGSNPSRPVCQTLHWPPLCTISKAYFLGLVLKCPFITPFHQLTCVSLHLNLLSSSLQKIYKTIILPVVLYGCETWSLTLREEHRLKMLENRVLRRIFGPKRDEVTGE
jgi:hypothetical protein